ncbi:hypothetical protein Zmor_010991 [Zophobas morio]|uniref:Uncharacterized protein n=1 Tax=Zophobas morio TaxID=2755281 RepID=A0AA38IM20_9CUCU|nr:hypothetical protein Zmor_010991 [Zophobas morio]
MKIWKKKGLYIIYDVLLWIYSSSNEDQGDSLPYPIAPLTSSSFHMPLHEKLMPSFFTPSPYPYPTIASLQLNLSRHDSSTGVCEQWRVVIPNCSRYGMSPKDFLWLLMVLVVINLPSSANHWPTI